MAIALLVSALLFGHAFASSHLDDRIQSLHPSVAPNVDTSSLDHLVARKGAALFFTHDETDRTSPPPRLLFRNTADFLRRL